jgi:hypothetical protein
MLLRQILDDPEIAFTLTPLHTESTRPSCTRSEP